VGNSLTGVFFSARLVLWLLFPLDSAKKGFVMDLEDQSVTRTDAQYRALFEQAGLELIATELQKKYEAAQHSAAAQIRSL